MKKVQNKHMFPCLSDARAVGMYPDKLMQIKRMLRENYIEKGKLAGAHLLVARGGKVVLDEVQGYANIEKKSPLQKDSVYRIYSMSKPITSVALMQLYEKGAFSLDDAVSAYLPEFEHQSVWVYGQYPTMISSPVSRPMTIRQLLTHTSGLSYEIQRLSYVDEAYRIITDKTINLSGNQLDKKDLTPSSMTLASYVENIAQLPLQYQPGTRWLYSASIDVCGRLIEVLSGKSLGRYLQEHLFEPLEMKDTGFYLEKSKQHRLTGLYQKRKEDDLVPIDTDIATSPLSQKPLMESGGGGLVSTMYDYYKFALMQLNQGKCRAGIF